MFQHAAFQRIVPIALSKLLKSAQFKESIMCAQLGTNTRSWPRSSHPQSVSNSLIITAAAAAASDSQLQLNSRSDSESVVPTHHTHLPPFRVLLRLDHFPQPYMYVLLCFIGFNWLLMFTSYSSMLYSTN
jgi:hypothetical protein